MCRRAGTGRNSSSVVGLTGSLRGSMVEGASHGGGVWGVKLSPSVMQCMHAWQICDVGGALSASRVGGGSALDAPCDMCVRVPADTSTCMRAVAVDVGGPTSFTSRSVAIAALSASDAPLTLRARFAGRNTCVPVRSAVSWKPPPPPPSPVSVCLPGAIMHERECVRRLLLSPNVNPHHSHSNGRSPECVRMCRRRFARFA